MQSIISENYVQIVYTVVIFVLQFKKPAHIMQFHTQLIDVTHNRNLNIQIIKHIDKIHDATPMNMVQTNWTQNSSILIN